MEEALALPDDEKYHPRPVNKADGTQRAAFNPHRLIRRIQRRINRRIFAAEGMLRWPSYVFGSIPNQRDGIILIPKDYVACAREHCRAKSLLKLDIKDFFDNISRDTVAEIFRDVFFYPPDVCDALASICCWGNRIVQGSLTSSYIASLVLHDVEGKVWERLARKNLIYTRYVDDITVSSKFIDTSFDFAHNLIRAMLEDKDLPLNENKTKIQRISTEALVVHGLRISFDEPRLPSDEVRRIRAAVRNVENLAREANYRTSHSYRHDFNRCMGRVNKLARVGHSQHRSLVKRLQAVVPLPSRKDIERMQLMVERLERDYAGKSGTYWYARRFYRAYERLNVLKRSFPVTAKEYQERLRKVKATYA